MNIPNAASTAEAFARTFGEQPSGVWSAPGRVNLIGEHTDYNGGLVFPFAIDRRAFVAFRPREGNLVRVASSAYQEPVEVLWSPTVGKQITGWSAYPLGVALTIQEMTGHQGSGFDLYIDSSVPEGAGLSSSAALECAVALALNDSWNLGLSRAELARVGQRAENVVVGAPTGIMDQYASMCGQVDAGVFLDCRDERVEVIPLGLAAAGLTVLVIDTREKHEHSTGGYAARRRSCDSAAETLGVSSLREVTEESLPAVEGRLDEETYRRVRHVVTENARVERAVAELRQHGPRSLGDLFAQSHASMRDDFEISTEALNRAVDSALAAGAVAARMTGGGFGGSAIALISRDDVEGTIDRIRETYHVGRGVAPAIFTVQPDEGARREDWAAL